MKHTSIFALLFCVGLASVDGYVTTRNTAKPKPVTPAFKKAATGAFAAFTIASNVLNVPTADASDYQMAAFSSSNIISEKVTRQGLYGEYDVDIVQDVDDARSTFKEAKETKSKKGKYTALLAVLIVGSFIIPMAQYFWYVRDDDSSDKFFAQDIPEPETKKKKWF